MTKRQSRGFKVIRSCLEEEAHKWKHIAVAEEVMTYILSLDVRVAVKVIRSITLLDDLGTQLPDDYVHFIGNIRGIRLWELRTRFQNFYERILFVRHRGRFYLLLSAFRKTTDKVPREEIERAIRILREYDSDNEV
ncbi:MAG: type II toxin-antitoxin system RelE/ParE family toxin [Bacillota bacterium]|nr:type II toxin-antitoxin system RelE/ParE family toxin [Bacillota bacterium]